ncbi:unnamed protein product [Nezara viridula]|uniref:Uncharacterized protein n=1 Tax=Nezara viridula TaxID=85310 RepID=A0A9P0HMN2_NEZVI|nr:unnamed protein product [Nezara viridula]
MGDGVYAWNKSVGTLGEGSNILQPLTEMDGVPVLICSYCCYCLVWSSLGLRYSPFSDSPSTNNPLYRGWMCH